MCSSDLLLRERIDGYIDCSPFGCRTGFHLLTWGEHSTEADVIGDLNARRGQIQGMEAMAGTQRVNAFVPLAQMFGYATDLRSKTQGRGQYVMEPSHYEPVPKNIADQIIAGRTKG